MIRDSLPAAGSAEPDACTWKPKDDSDILEKAKTVGILATANEDVRSLRATLIYGLKGVAAYYTHAEMLGKNDDTITTFLQKGLASTLQDLTVAEMVALVLECGRIGVTTLALLDGAKTSAYGNPQITSVKTTVGTHPGILITGHDLKDMAQLLEQTKHQGWMCILTARCSRRMRILHSKNIRTSMGTTVARGTPSAMSSRNSTARY